MDVEEVQCVCELRYIKKFSIFNNPFYALRFATSFEGQAMINFNSAIYLVIGNWLFI